MITFFFLPLSVSCESGLKPLFSLTEADRLFLWKLEEKKSKIESFIEN